MKTLCLRVLPVFRWVLKFPPTGWKHAQQVAWLLESSLCENAWVNGECWAKNLSRMSSFQNLVQRKLPFFRIYTVLNQKNSFVWSIKLCYDKVLTSAVWTFASASVFTSISKFLCALSASPSVRWLHGRLLLKWLLVCTSGVNGLKLLIL